MTVFANFQDRQVASFKMFLSAVAGVRAANQAAGVTHPSLLARQATERMAASLGQSMRYEMLRFASDFDQSALGEVQEERQAKRYEAAVLALTSIIDQVVKKAGREGLPEISLQKMVSGNAGAIGLLIQQRASAPTFQVKDSAGRTWDAEKLFKVIIRDFAYQTYIDHKFQEALSAGEIKVEASDGQIYDLSSSWLEIRDRDFHINSQKVI